MINLNKAKELFAERRQAYLLVFNKENQYLKTVMEDLEKFCRVNETSFHPDARIHAALEGRREVYLRIKDYVTLTPDELLNKYGKGKPE